MCSPPGRPYREEVHPGLPVQQLDGLHPELYGGAVLHQAHVQLDVGGPEVEVALVTGPASPVKYQAGVHDGDLNQRHHPVTRRDVVLEPGEVDLSTIGSNIQICQRASGGVIRAGVTIVNEGLLWLMLGNVSYPWFVLRHGILF